MAAKIVWTINADGANTARQVKSVLETINTLHDKLHMVARNAMIQVLVNSQATPLVNLLEGLSGKSIHVKGLKDWAEKHGRGITIGLVEKKITVKFPKPYTTMTKEEALDWALTVPSFWAENPPPSAFKGFDYDAELAKLNKRAEDMARALEEGTIKQRGEIVELSEKDKEAIKLGAYKRNLVVKAPTQDAVITH